MWERRSERTREEQEADTDMLNQREDERVKALVSVAQSCIDDAFNQLQAIKLPATRLLLFANRHRAAQQLELALAALQRI